MRSVRDQRESLIQQFFPDGMPSLWCPAITHVNPDGSFDVRRMEALLRRVADFATGWLMFGPTGNGDQLSDDDVVSLLPFVSQTAVKHNSYAFIGATCDSVDASVRRAELVIDWVRDNGNQNENRGQPTIRIDELGNTHPSFVKTHILGIAVSPLTSCDADSDHEATLRQFLNLGVPVAICQPPVEPGALMDPALVGRLASEYPNFVLFEDSSGQDRVAMSSADLLNVKKLRGAQGNFIPSTKSMGGNYDGLMAGAVNGFGMQLAEMLGFLDEGFAAQAVNLITPVQRVAEEVSSAVAALPFGNRFANAQHAIDHFLAHGREPQVASHLIGGHTFPGEVLDRVRTTLNENGFLRTKGYLSNASHADV